MSSTDSSSSDPRRLREALSVVRQRYWRQVELRPWTMLTALLLPGVGNIFVFYVPPLAMAHILGRITREPTVPATALVPAVLVLASAWLVGEIIWRLAALLISRAEVYGMETLYVEAMNELAAKHVGFFHENFAGSLTKKALGYARRFEDICDLFAFNISGNLLPLGFAVVVLWRFSPWLVLVLLGSMTVTFLLVRPLLKRRARLVDDREAASNALSGHVADTIANAETVRAFAREKEEAAIHAKNVRDYGMKVLRSWDYQSTRVDMVTSPLYILTNTLGLIVALAVGQGKGVSVEAIFLTFSYFAQSTRLMWEFNRTYRQLESSLTDAAQFTELLLTPPAIVDATPARPFSPRDASVHFRGVRFAYGKRSPLFDDFDLKVRAGERVGLVGRSGGGKTTLTRLLLRFADVQGGSIEIGGDDIALVAQSALREFIAMVPQDPAMFHRTIADNIRFGRPSATDEEVRQAARRAHASEFIETLPAGYDTLVGERGVKLSGGQRQRIAIARAILKDAPILVLDEATSSLDSESEAEIQKALWTVMEDRTAIVIAHRLSTVRRMDRLIVLDGGRIVEEGTHEELLAHGGHYASLWGHQSGGFLQESA